MDSENIGESKYTVLLSTSFLSTCTSHDQNVTKRPKLYAAAAPIL